MFSWHEKNYLEEKKKKSFPKKIMHWNMYIKWWRSNSNRKINFWRNKFLFLKKISLVFKLSVQKNLQTTIYNMHECVRMNEACLSVWMNEMSYFWKFRNSKFTFCVAKFKLRISTQNFVIVLFDLLIDGEVSAKLKSLIFIDGKMLLFCMLNCSFNLSEDF